MIDVIKFVVKEVTNQFVYSPMFRSKNDSDLSLGKITFNLN